MRQKYLIIVIALLHTLLLYFLRLFPYPELFVYPYLAENGFIPYRHIFDQHLPSFLMMPVNFYDLGLRNENDARLFLIGSVAITHLFLFIISKKLLDKQKYHFLPNLLYLLTQPLFAGNFLWLDTFLAPILLASYYFCLRFLEFRSAKYAFFAGVFLGLTLYFKQVMLLLTLFVLAIIFIKTKSRMWLKVAAFSAVIPFLITLLWVLSNDLLVEFFYWTVSFNFEVYSELARSFPTSSQFFKWWVIILLPSMIMLLTKLKKINRALLFSYTVLSLVIVVPRFDFVHLQPALPFALIATSAILLSNLTIKYMLIVISGSLLIVWWPIYLKTNLYKPSILFTAEIFRVSEKVNSLTQESEKIFVLGTQPIVYPLSGRFPAGGVFTVNVPWNMKVAEETIYQKLIHDPPKLIVRDSKTSIDGKKVVDFTPRLNGFIDENYELLDKVGENEILLLK